MIRPFRLRRWIRYAVWLPGVLLGWEGGGMDRFEQLSGGIPTAEVRSVHCGRFADGRRFVLIRPQDCGRRGYLLLCHVESGLVEQHFVPQEVPQSDTFGGLLTEDGRYYFDYPKGRLLEFRVEDGRYRVCGVPSERAVHFMSYAAAPDGSIWMGYYPGGGLCRYRPSDGGCRDFGRLEAETHYVFELVVAPDGWVYAGTGTQKAGVFAFHSETGELRQLLPERERVLGFGSVRLLQDGTVAIRGGAFQGVAAAGKRIRNAAPETAEAPSGAIRYFGVRNDFGDGSKLVRCDLDAGELVVAEADGAMRTIPLRFHSGGVFLTSLGLGPDGKIYGSTAHPMRLISYDPEQGRVMDLGANPVVGGGNFCNFAADGRYLYACEYPGGRLWRFDPSCPIRFRSGGGEWFGLPPERLAHEGEARYGVWLADRTPRLLRAVFQSFRPEFTVRLPVPAPGDYYLNIRFYEHSFCRNLTVEFGGRRYPVEISDTAAPVLSLGPVRLTGPAAPVRFLPDYMPDNNNFFAVSGMELAAAPRGTEPDDGLDNPRPLARWAELITRPRVILRHPSGDLIMAGHSNYGLSGGGFGVVAPDGGRREIGASWMPGHSCIALTVLPDGSLVGGTSNEAPGGGATAATAAAVFRMTWPNGAVVAKTAIPGENYLVAIAAFQRNILVASGPGRLYVLDPVSLRLLHRVDQTGYGSVPRNGLAATPDGRRLFLLQERGIFELDGTGSVRLIGVPPEPITGGSTYLDGFLYYTSDGKLYRFAVPPPAE